MLLWEKCFLEGVKNPHHEPLHRYDISEIVQTYLYLFPHAISAYFFSIKKHFFRAI